MKKLFTPFVFLAITGMMTACGESPVGVAEIDTPDAVTGLAREIDCPEEGEPGWPSPNSFLCGEG